MSLEFFVAGSPMAQGRPRATVLPTGRLRVYDPARSRAWKESVRLQALGHRPPVPFEAAVRLALTFTLPRPKRLPQRIVEHTRRPDLDNLVKAVKDALRGIAYRDDAQIVSLVARKQYGGLVGVSVTCDLA